MGNRLVPIWLDMERRHACPHPPNFSTYKKMRGRCQTSRLQLVATKLEGHERAFPPPIPNQIGTSRIPVKKTIVLKGQNDVLTYPGVRIRGKY